MNNAHLAPSFQVLQREWYGKLKSTGFVDIETSLDDSWSFLADRPHCLLHVDIWSDWFQDEMSEHLDMSRAAYYELAAKWLYEGVFSDPREWDIWAMHCEGLGCREIARELYGSPRQRMKVQRRIERIRREMLQRPHGRGRK